MSQPLIPIIEHPRAHAHFLPPKRSRFKTLLTMAIVATLLIAIASFAVAMAIVGMIAFSFFILGAWISVNVRRLFEKVRSEGKTP